MKVIWQHISAGFFLVSTAAVANVSVKTEIDANHPLLKRFLSKQLEKGYTNQEVTDFLQPAKKNEEVLRLIQRPWEAKPWYEYYPIFLNQKRIDEGVRFWQQYHEPIHAASQKFKVDPEVIVSILGVETFYGKMTGVYNVRDALYSLSFFYPPRADLFVRELGFFMDLTYREGVDPKQAKGSYAGAMGYSQFISSSYLSYAVDFNKNGRRNLQEMEDAIGSIANYLHQHHWRYQEKVIHAAQIGAKKTDINALLWAKEPIKRTLAQWQKYDVEPTKPTKVTSSEKAILFQLDHQQHTEYWFGLHNFYVITRYNHSHLYAMAVHELGQRIKTKYEATLGKK
jgi:membrane-bound lytic murein transglycosylase B